MKKHLKELMALLQSYGWESALFRWPCTDERNPSNHARTTAAMNALVAWRPGKWVRVCWIWEIWQVSESELVERIEEKKEAA